MTSKDWNAAIEAAAKVVEAEYRSLTQHYQKPAGAAAMVAFRILKTIRTLTQPTTSTTGEDDVERALDAYNGGLVRVPDENNPRGYTNKYQPKVAMRAALAAQEPSS